MSARYQNQWLGLVIYFLMVYCAVAKFDNQHHFLEQVSTTTFSKKNESGKERFIGILTEEDGQTSYTYDNVGRPLTVTKEGKTITRQYDTLGRLTQFTDTEGNTLNYTYDAIGRLTTLTYPDGKTVTYNYDANSRLTTVTDWAGRKTQYSYDKAGRLLETQRPNGTKQTLIYGNDKKKKKKKNDKAGLLTQLTDTAGGKVLIDYHYDYNRSGQLSRQQGEPEIEAPALPKPVDMSYDADNRLINYNSQTLSYDPNGNLLNSPFGNYNYDSRNQLTEAGTTTYLYDPENRRIAIQSPEGTTQLIHNPNALLSQLLVRKSPDGKTTYYIYGLGLLYQEIDSQAKYYHFDHQGNTLSLTDQSGQVTDQFAYSPYGETIKREGTTETPFRYNGRFGVMTDPNGLLHMRARYYSPELKRFLNQDILLGNIAEPLTLNRYAYVNGDPVNMVDPFGLSAMDSTGNWFGNALGITVGSASLPFVGIENASFLANWFSGSLPSQIIYAENSPQILDMMASGNAAVMHNEFNGNNFQSQFNMVYDSDDAFFDTITNPYSTAFQVGGTGGSSVVNNGNGTATFTINNTAGTKSFFYHLVPNRTSKSGMMHNVSQTFQWTELIYQDPNQH